MSHDHNATAHGADAGAHKPHVLGIHVYLGVWVGLLLLTVLTVYVSYFSFGDWNLGIAMIVASAKAALVCLFFMHLKYDERFNLIVFLSSLAFLSLLFILTMADFETRGDVDPLERGTIQVLPAAPAGMGGHGAAADSASHGAEGDSTAAGHGAPAESGSGDAHSSGGDAVGSGGGH